MHIKSSPDDFRFFSYPRLNLFCLIHPVTPGAKDVLLQLEEILEKSLSSFQNPEGRFPKNVHDLSDCIGVIGNAYKQMQLHIESLHQPERSILLTFDCCWIIDDFALIFHTGDNELFLSRLGKKHTLTKTHTLGQEDAATPERFKSTLVRALGLPTKPDVLCFQLIDQDEISLQCKDNVHKQLTLTYSSSQKTKHIKNAIKIAEELNLFQRLTYSQLLQILECSTYKVLPKGFLLYAEGDASDTFFVISEGTLRVEKDNSLLLFRSKGEVVGEMGIIENLPRTANVICESEIHGLEFNRTALLKCFDENPVIGYKLIWSLAQFLTQKLKETSFLQKK